MKQLIIKKKESYIDLNVQFSWKKGELLSIVGPNGVGKSTFVKEVLKTYFTNKNVSYVPQIPMCVLGDRTLKNLAETLYHFDKECFKEHYLLNDLKKSALWDRPIRKLSGGENTWIKICVALCIQTNYFIWDEPTTYLDVNKKETISKILTDLLPENYLMIVEHDKEFVNSINGPKKFVNLKGIDDH